VSRDDPDNKKFNFNYPIGISSTMKTLRKYYLLALIPSLVLLTGGIMFREFVLHAIHINPVLNLFIIGVAVFGVALIMYDIYKVSWEYNKLNLFYARSQAGEALEDLVKDPTFAGTEIAKVLVSVANTKGRLTTRTGNHRALPG
jgi:hypothetical protein